VTATSTATTWTQGATPTPVAPQRPHTWNIPDWSKDDLKCYDSGQRALRVHLINPVDSFCNAYTGQSFQPSW
jgi:chitinase